MNCEDFESNVNDLVREQIMEAGIRAQTLAHGGGMRSLRSPAGRSAFAEL